MTLRKLRIVEPVALYARYSTDRQDARSIDDQLRRCRGYADQSDLPVAAEYQDAAMSGSHTERDGLQRLLRDAKQRNFEAILVDDLSRLSRDLGATWRLVFEEMAALGVRVIDCSTGTASDDESARLLFGVKALVNDEFLQNVRRQTWRGLEGRALAGFHTGGKTFGFTSVTEPNPADPEHPRKAPRIDQDEAAVVLRIFREAAAGASTQTVAERLNQDNVPAPHDGGRGHKGNRGWGHTTIRAMLRNDRYIGVLRWNECKWVRVPGKRARRRIERPESEHIVRECPELRIVPADLWDAVQQRLGRNRRPRGGRTPGVGKDKPPLLAGLLRCGVCGGSMTVQTRVTKNGKAYRNFGCTTRWSRGIAICSNSRMISELKLREVTLGMLHRELQGPEIVQRFVAAVDKRYRELERTDHRSQDLDRQIRTQEQRIKNATEALVKIGWSDALGAALKVEEEKLATLKASATDQRRTRPRTLLHPKVIEGYLRNLLDILEGESGRAREILARHIEPLVLTPTAEGGYRITGAFNLTAAAPGEGAAVFENGSSGGVI